MGDARSLPKSQSRPPHPLRRYRDRQNLTMRELGGRAGGLVESEISRIESGARDMPSCSVMLSLAQATAFEVTPTDIFRWHFWHATGEHPDWQPPVLELSNDTGAPGGTRSASA
jgi:transcriptional regulator with XRE-family HTH domain